MKVPGVIRHQPFVHREQSGVITGGKPAASEQLTQRPPDDVGSPAPIWDSLCVQLNDSVEIVLMIAASRTCFAARAMHNVLVGLAAE